MIWTIIGSTAAFLTMLGFFPQVFKIYKSKSVKDISIIAILQFSLGVFLWLLYGIHLKDPIIIVANSVTLFSLIIALFLYFKYSRNP